MDKEQIHQLITDGEIFVVADYILMNWRQGKLMEMVTFLCEALRAELAFGHVAAARAHLELGLNLVGRECYLMGYTDDEIADAREVLLESVQRCDDIYTDTMNEAVNEILAEIQAINKGDSLVGLIAERIETGLGQSVSSFRFIVNVHQQLTSSIYWKMIDAGLKFGNDYALGLRWLRHLGFCQVSTNPVLCPKAYAEDPTLVAEFKAVLNEGVQYHGWLHDPDKYADDLLVLATLLAIQRNMAIFWPLSRRVRCWDYMVSLQLLTDLDDDVERSVESAIEIHKQAMEFLRLYGLKFGILGEVDDNHGANIVFKVPGSHKAALEITEQLNALGIGTNNTLTFTVAQEIALILAAFKGKATAVKSSKRVVRNYETNMGGRLASHLREYIAEWIFNEIATTQGSPEICLKALRLLAYELKVDIDNIPGGLADKIRQICAYKNLKTLNKEGFLSAAIIAGWDRERVELYERAIQASGTYIARRVWWVFFSEENKGKWITFLQKEYDITEDKARQILESMDVLPASKRIPEDTTAALGVNMCHTEFPNHSRVVQEASEKPDFTWRADSISEEPDPELLAVLIGMDDFRLAYGLTPGLMVMLIDAGIDEVAEWGMGGLAPDQWPDFGPVQKTMTEFRAAAEAFKQQCVEWAKEAAAKLDLAI